MLVKRHPKWGAKHLPRVMSHESAQTPAPRNRLYKILNYVKAFYWQPVPGRMRTPPFKIPIIAPGKFLKLRQ